LRRRRALPARRHRPARDPEQALPPGPSRGGDRRGAGAERLGSSVPGGGAEAAGARIAAVAPRPYDRRPPYAPKPSSPRPMLQAIRSKAGSLVVKLLFAFLIISFGVWGIGDIFRQRGVETTVATVG